MEPESTETRRRKVRGFLPPLGEYFPSTWGGDHHSNSPGTSSASQLQLSTGDSAQGMLSRRQIRSLMADLATFTRNTMALAASATFLLFRRLTPLQQRTF